VIIFRAFKTELDPNDKQKTLFVKHAGCRRFVYNWGLGRKIEAQRNGEKSPGAMELHRELTSLKKTEFSWMYECSKCVAQAALQDLDDAFVRFFRRCKENKKGKKGFPKFRARKDGIGSFRLYGRISVTNSHVRLPKIGWVKLKEENYLPTSGTKVLSAIISQRVGCWFISLVVEEENQDHQKVKYDDHSIVGVDLGIKTLAVCSDGAVFDSPNLLSDNRRKLRRLQKSLSRKKNGSNNWRKAAKRVARFYHRIANIRSDSLHKITTHLTRTKSVVVIEDLNIRGMLKNHHWAGAISDAGLYQFRRQLEYKGLWYGCQIIVADRFYPSSKTCSDCGFVNQALTLNDRTWTCPVCGCIHDRDFNAAVNLEHWGVASLLAASSAESLNACGEEGSGGSVSCHETSLCEAGIRQEAAV
jgi:putative transposase